MAALKVLGAGGGGAATRPNSWVNAGAGGKVGMCSSLLTAAQVKCRADGRTLSYFLLWMCVIPASLDGSAMACGLVLPRLLMNVAPSPVKTPSQGTLWWSTSKGATSDLCPEREEGASAGDWLQDRGVGKRPVGVTDRRGYLLALKESGVRKSCRSCSFPAPPAAELGTWRSFDPEPSSEPCRSSRPPVFLCPEGLL